MVAMARVLIVDDDVDLCSMLKLTVERAGHSAVVTADPQEAVGAMERADFDLILLDIDMPFMDGLSFARLLRESPGFLRYRIVPIVMMTGKDDVGVMAESFDAGAVYHLNKPFTPREVLETIRLVLHAV